jgi:hypothetical protein
MQPFSLNQTGTLLIRHLAQFVAAIDNLKIKNVDQISEAQFIPYFIQTNRRHLMLVHSLQQKGFKFLVVSDPPTRDINFSVKERIEI